jgi:hypothetical protein
MGAALRMLTSSAAGVVASLPMLAVLAAIKRPVEPVPPRKVAMKTLSRFHLPRPKDRCTKKAVTLASHLGYGGLAGALYALLGRVAVRRPLSSGVLYALGVWAASYYGWIPAAGVQNPPHKRPWRENAALLAGHVSWGALLGSLYRRLRGR